MKTRYIPAIVCLSAGFITCMLGISGEWGLFVFMKRLLLVLVCFYVLGGIVAYILQKNFAEMKEDAAESADKEETQDGEQAQNIDNIDTDQEK